MLSFGLTSVSYGSYLNDWTDDQLCGWMDNPSPPAHIAAEVQEREISCEGGVAAKSAASKIETTYQEMIDSQDSDSTPPKDKCSETTKKRVTSEEYLSESKTFTALKEFLIDEIVNRTFLYFIKSYTFVPF